MDAFTYPYPNPSWIILKGVPDRNFAENAQDINHEYMFVKFEFKIVSHALRI